MKNALKTVQHLAREIAQLPSGGEHASRSWKLRALAEDRGFTDQDWDHAEEIALDYLDGLADF
jgi:hypothetical protein